MRLIQNRGDYLWCPANSLAQGSRHFAAYIANELLIFNVWIKSGDEYFMHTRINSLALIPSSLYPSCLINS